MEITHAPRRALGTMVAYGYPGGDLGHDLAIAHRLGATVLEILPDWKRGPDPRSLRARVADAGLTTHSAHGCWGGQSIRAPRVDLGSLDPATHRASVDDLKECVDWLAATGGTCLVIHPGGLSDSDQFDPRRDALVRGLLALADHARDTPVILCVENMPPGVHPGSRSADLVSVVAEVGRKEIALAIDTGHAHISNTPRAETVDAGPWLRTTHVHDNDGRQDSHLPPGNGTVDWADWADALNAVDYRGPIMLECIRHLRSFPESFTPALFERLDLLTAIRPS